MLSQLLSISFLAAIVSAASLPISIQARAGEITAEQILKIAPKSATCPTPADECATNEQAAPFLNEAMSTYDIQSPAEKASIISLIAYESGDFKYSTNHFPAPGRPGQGTRNMQMASYNLDYVKSIPELASKITYTSTDGLSPEQLNEIRALVLPDKYSWASAAWYLSRQVGCSDARKALQAGGDDGFKEHMKCVGISEVAEDRLAYWNAAKEAFGL